MANYNWPEVWAVENLVTPEWADAISTSHILVAMLKKGSNWNSGFQRVDDITGSRAILPIITSLGNAEFVTRAGMYSEMSYSATADGAFDFAKYEYTNIRSAFKIDWRTKQILAKGKSARGLDPYKGEIARMKAKVRSIVQAGLVGNNNAAENTLLGLQYMFPNSPSVSTNEPGGFAYNANAFWRPFDRDVAGAFSTSLLNQGQTDSRRDTADNLDMANLCLVNESSTTRIWSKILDAYVDKQRFVQDKELAQLGFANIVWNVGGRDMVIAPLSDGPTGTIYFLNMDYFYGDINDDLSMEEPIRPEGKNVTEYMFIDAIFIGSSNMARHGKYRGITT